MRKLFTHTNRQRHAQKFEIFLARFEGEFSMFWLGFGEVWQFFQNWTGQTWSRLSCIRFRPRRLRSRFEEIIFLTYCISLMCVGTIESFSLKSISWSRWSPSSNQFTGSELLCTQQTGIYTYSAMLIQTLLCTLFASSTKKQIWRNHLFDLLLFIDVRWLNPRRDHSTFDISFSVTTLSKDIRQRGIDAIWIICPTSTSAPNSTDLRRFEFEQVQCHLLGDKQKVANRIIPGFIRSSKQQMPNLLETLWKKQFTVRLCRRVQFGADISPTRESHFFLPTWGAKYSKWGEILLVAHLDTDTASPLLI